MKRIALTPQIEQHLRRSLGNEVDLTNYAVYEAIALNTQPIRKRHPIYQDARMDSSVLYEMAAALREESRPIQLEHDKSVSPIGRVFHGEVINSNELRTLFFIDASETATISKLDSGTIDQVSVSVLTKQILNSVSGFDYLGPTATLDNFFSGDDGEGNVLGKDGVFARLVGMDSFFEMSLVGQGGARGARIISREESYFGSSYQKLAASGHDPNVYVLAATATQDKDDETMDLSTLIADLTAKGVELVTVKAEAANSLAAKTTAETNLAAANTELEALRTEVADLKAGAAGDLVTATAERDAAKTALTTVATVLLTAAGKTEADLPADVKGLTDLIDENKTTLAAKLVAGGVGIPADAADKGTASLPISGAFRTRAQ